jgi:putative hydrolase of the HAD superfamily
MVGTLRPDPAMIDAITGLKARGVPVAIVSNSMGDDGYRRFDLDALADAVVISGQVRALEEWFG